MESGWKLSPPSGFQAPTSLLTTPGPSTSGPWLRRLSSGYTSCVSSGRTVWTQSCCLPSITPPWWAYTHCLSVWYEGSTAEDRKVVQRVINTAQKITGRPLPSLENIATSYCLRRTKAITGDPSHPVYSDMLPSGPTKSHTSRLTNSFLPWAIRAAAQFFSILLTDFPAKSMWCSFY